MPGKGRLRHKGPASAREQVVVTHQPQNALLVDRQPSAEARSDPPGPIVANGAQQCACTNIAAILRRLISAYASRGRANPANAPYTNAPPRLTASPRGATSCSIHATLPWACAGLRVSHGGSPMYIPYPALSAVSPRRGPLNLLQAAREKIQLQLAAFQPCASLDIIRRPGPDPHPTAQRHRPRLVASQQAWVPPRPWCSNMAVAPPAADFFRAPCINSRGTPQALAPPPARFPPSFNPLAPLLSWTSRYYSRSWPPRSSPR